MAQLSLPATLTATPNLVRGGVDVAFPISEETVASEVVVASPLWSLAGWQLQIVMLPAAGRLSIPGDRSSYYAKVITGQLIAPQRAAYARPLQIRSTKVDESTITAGPEGALVAIFNETPNAPATLSSMDQIQFDGPLASDLPFELFHDKFGSFTDAFKGADAYMSPGIHLLDATGVELCNLIFWTAGKGVSLTTHNHGQPPSAAAPAFAEVHWVFRNGTGNGGMYSATSQDAPPTQRYPMQTGEEHGPFFNLVDDSNNNGIAHPKLRDNGAVDYPWHGWNGGTDNKPGQAYDLVCAFEIAPRYALVRS